MITNGRIQLYPLLRVAIMLIMGIILGNALYGVVAQWVWMLSTVALLSVSLLLWRRPIIQSTVIMIIIILAGAWCVTAQIREVSVALPDVPVEYEAVVAGRPVVRGKVVRCDLLLTDGPLAGHKVKASILRDAPRGFP